jgi:cold shock CspA family protein
MKIFGTVSSFDNHNGVGFIKPEAGGSDLGFERKAIAWDGKETPPTAGQRLSYDIGKDSHSKPCALNLQTV